MGAKDYRNWNPAYINKKPFDPNKPVHPSQRIDANIQYSSITSGTKLPYSATEKCMITHDGNALEEKMKRDHTFQSDPSVKHVKGNIAVCDTTRGNNKKGAKPDVSREQGPSSGVYTVNVKKLIKKFQAPS
ncbi:hypothetical protein [Wolbachia endosymbiont of Ctenocephalides felis wCfeT]|uniref:hypothetical protein n=1 Tax=Wolbachia endosymbiont of Ctenocephalides felis wCfeT TaxID=2732593 RepID=UPI0014461A7A|nr:hypothetical protein [Wolbachia endosymbiont of Ctenocephalides felis wCfeT]